MATPKRPAGRQRGSIEQLPSGSLRVRVYAGIDPVTKRRHYLEEVVPAGPKAAKDAEKVRTRLLNEVDERRNPRTRSTINQMLDRYLRDWRGERLTLKGYEGVARNHIRPLIGHVLVAAVDADVFDSASTAIAPTSTPDARPTQDHIGHDRNPTVLQSPSRCY